MFFAELQLTDQQVENLTLLEIEKYLQANRRTLRKFTSIPHPDGYVLEQLGNRLIYDERNYDVESLKQEHAQLFATLTGYFFMTLPFDMTHLYTLFLMTYSQLSQNSICRVDEQRGHYNKIISAVNKQDGGVFFLHGFGGTGKTFIWRTLASALRSKQDIVFTVATSGIAAKLLPGGRTAHSKFKIPIPTLDNSSCKIPYDSDLGQLLRQTKLIIWDEAPMTHMFCFEALDRCLKDLMSEIGNSDKILVEKLWFLEVISGKFFQLFQEGAVLMLYMLQLMHLIFGTMLRF
jgi:ATP-dependent DNA helicase PIF1